MSLSPTTIPFETTGTTGTFVSFQVSSDLVGDNATVEVYAVQNFTPLGNLNSANELSALTLPNIAASNSVFWNALWLIGGDLGRHDGYYQFVIAISIGGTTVLRQTDPTLLLQITSVDIHNMNVKPSLDANGQPSFPYAISYALAKTSLVSVRVNNSSGTVRTIVSNQSQFGEATFANPITTNTVTWDGLSDSGHPVPLGVYTVAVDAKDPGSTDQAFQRSRTAAVASLASLTKDPQHLFEDNVFAFPNPVRQGQATIQAQAVRDGANLSIRIYTLAGDLVREQTYNGVAAGNIVAFAWNALNQSGRKVGRGLYYYVVREDDGQGTLQTVKKVAVIQ